MSREFVAKASVSIRASADRVWDAFTKSEVIKQYMFGTDVLSDWKEGSSIAWNGEWQGKRYEDKGVILKLKPRRLIQYSHFSPLSGLLDKPENHHIVTIELSGKGKVTIVSLTQDNNGTEEAKKHSEQNWTTMLQELKKLLEK